MPRKLRFADLRQGEFFYFVESDGEMFLKVDSQHFEDEHQRRFRVNDASSHVARNGDD